MKSRSRLYCPAALFAGATVALDAGQVHYLRDVMRLGEGALVSLFNARHGEWTASVLFFKKDKGEVEVKAQTRLPEPRADIRLALVMALIKRDAMDWVVEKAGELGVHDIHLITTGRTQSSHTNIIRLQTIAHEAAEQCDRLDVPQVHDPVSLARFMADKPPSMTLLFAAENGDALPAFDAMDLKRDHFEQVAVLIGPEGGFTEEEHAMIRRQPNVQALRLGPRLMRAETAAIATLSAWQAVKGDWRQ